MKTMAESRVLVCSSGTPRMAFVSRTTLSSTGTRSRNRNNTNMLPRLFFAITVAIIACHRPPRTLLADAFCLLPLDYMRSPWAAGVQHTFQPAPALFAAPGGQRQPRRNLQKRRRKKKSGLTQEDGADTNLLVVEEWKPLVASKSKEMGEDYWIDEQDMKQEAKAIKFKAGQIPQDKLWVEVLQPYKQNWIGIMSVIIVILATLVTQFPELLQPVAIPIPDL